MMRSFAFIVENIMSVCFFIASRLCEHSTLVRFEKRAAEPLQRGHRYGDILMVYDIINAFPTYTVFWSNTPFKYQTWKSSYPIHWYADVQRVVPADQLILGNA